ncbi:TolC family protein [Xanthocytophaga agilis]|uniref:TolC family protein n=1 Tax=Xanthocytophaga agilis TaxID=3048010 RepID=A0AAE3R0Z0_9BACT|nr:TolC family protein [Xanthocytophaga agilis]MDJ1499632.1 TolC family protein [Xanthocytophaga agilis]
MRHPRLFKNIACSGIVLLLCIQVIAQQTPPTRISWDRFLNTVMQHPDIVKEKEKVNLTRLDIDVAKIKPDPELEFGNVCGDISGINMAQQWYVGVNYTIETGNKRKYRIQYARSSVQLEEAEFELFVLDFARSALKQYYQCWVLEQKINQLKHYHHLLPPIKPGSVSDSLSHLRQLIMLEHDKLALADAQHQYEEAIQALQGFVDYLYPDSMVLPDTAINPEYIFSMNDVNQQYSIKNHAELKVKSMMEQMANDELLMTQHNRIPDISFSLGNNFIARATNPEAPSPAYNAITATLSVPLKFSNMNKSELKIIQYNKEAAMEELRNEWDEKEDELSDLQYQLRRLDTRIKHVKVLIEHQTSLVEKVGKINPLLLDEEYQRLKHYHQLYWESTEKLIGVHLDLSFMTGRYEKLIGSTVAGMPTD